MTTTSSPAPDRQARKAALEAKLKPFIAATRRLLASFGPKASKSDLARILIVECIEAGYRTEEWITLVTRDLPLRGYDVIAILDEEAGPAGLWQCDEDERYSLVPTL